MNPLTPCSMCAAIPAVDVTTGEIHDDPDVVDAEFAEADGAES